MLCSNAPLHCWIYCGAGFVGIAVKLTTVVPSTAGAKSSVLIDGVKLSLWFVSGNVYGTLCRWLHHVFMSTGVKKIPYAAWSTSPLFGILCERQVAFRIFNVLHRAHVLVPHAVVDRRMLRQPERVLRIPIRIPLPQV